MGVKKLHETSSENIDESDIPLHNGIKMKKNKKKVHETCSPKAEPEKSKTKIKASNQEENKKNKIRSPNSVKKSQHNENKSKITPKKDETLKKMKRKSVDNEDERIEKTKVKKIKKSKSPEKSDNDKIIEKTEVKKMKSKSPEKPDKDERIEETKVEKIKMPKSLDKPKTPVKRIHEQTKAQKRPLDSSDDEEEVQSRSVKKRGEVEGIPSLPKSLFSLTGETVTAAVQEEEESSDEEELNKGEVKKRRKVSRAQKQRDAKQLEEQLREAERSRLTKDTIGPQTEDDYRELLLTNKACSATWIQYISFLLAAGEHERARATARRGLSIIPFEEQKERTNLWVVLLRLEVMYGMDDSAAETALAEACSNADDYTILTSMADIYQENEMPDKAEEIHRRVTKKYYAELDAWVLTGQFYFSTGRLDDARTALSKALRVLKKREGVDVTCRFAQLEHKYGDVDKSKSMFESLLANFPKRIDVWNVYVDLLIKANDTEQARNVLSRMCCLQMKLSKKMSLFAKWRQFEQTHGNARTQEAAKRTIDELLLKEEAALDE